MYKDQKPFLDDIVARCERARNPIPGIFLISNLHSNHENFYSQQLDAVKLLLSIEPLDPAALLKLHTLASIREQSNEIGISQQRKFLSSTLQKLFGLKDSNSSETLTISFGNHSRQAEARIVTDAWSVLGIINLRKQESLLSTFIAAVIKKMPNHRLPGLNSPATMPITEGFVMQRGFKEPLNQWLPAFRESATQQSPAITYDLIDFSIALKDFESLDKYCDLVISKTDDPMPSKAEYLSRQAAHAYDTHRLSEICLENDDSSESSFIPRSFRSGANFVDTLTHGSKITQDAWSGKNSNARPFRVQGHDVKEMIYCVIDKLEYKGDSELQLVIRKMHREGHDVVVQHIDDDNEHKKNMLLPLHMCARLGYVECFGELIAAGADPKALEYAEKIEGQTIEDVIESREFHANNDAILSILRSLHARHVATDLLGEIERSHKFRIIYP